jgi:hypothetical protein
MDKTEGPLELESEEPTDKPAEKTDTHATKPEESLKLEESTEEDETEEAEVQEPRGWCTTFIFCSTHTLPTHPSPADLPSSLIRLVFRWETTWLSRLRVDYPALNAVERHH